MTLLNELLAQALTVIDATEAEVATWIEQTLKDTGDDDLRSIRERQLTNPFGSSTPLHQQISSSEFHLSKLEAEAVPLLKKVLPKLLAIELKRSRVAILKKAGDRRAAAPRLGDREGRRVYLALGAELTRLGATQWKVRQLGDEERIICADLVKWKAEDPALRDPDNPWVAVRTVYAERTIRKVETYERPDKLSVASPPPPDSRHPGGDRYWRFGLAKSADPVAHSSPSQPGHMSIGSGSAGERSASIIPAPTVPLDEAARAGTEVLSSDVSSEPPPVIQSVSGRSVPAWQQDAAALASDHARRIARARQQVDPVPPASIGIMTGPSPATDLFPSPPPVPNERLKAADLVRAARDRRRAERS